MKSKQWAICRCLCATMMYATCFLPCVLLTCGKVISFRVCSRERYEKPENGEKLMIINEGEGDNLFAGDADSNITCIPEFLKSIDPDSFNDSVCVLVKSNESIMKFDPSKPHSVIAYINDEPRMANQFLLRDYKQLLVDCEKKAEAEEILSGDTTRYEPATCRV